MSADGVDLLLTVVQISVLAFVVGIAVQFALAHARVAIRSTGVTVGLGLAAIGIVVALSFFVLGDPLPLLWGVIGLAVLVDAFVVVQAVRRAPTERALLRRLIPATTDLVAAAATVIVLMPVIAQGQQYWTSGTNDFPSYAASVEVWLGESGHAEAWTERHPDNFGELQQFRGMHEKPVVTAIMLSASETSDTPPWELLGPLSLIFVFVLLASVMAAVRAQWETSALVTAAAVLVPSLSIVPMSRVLDAQLGQAAAVALLATLAAVAVEFTRARTVTRLQLALGAVVCGLLAAAALGTNATLVVGTVPAWGALVAVLAWRLNPDWRGVIQRLALAAAVAFVASLPMISAYRDSVSAQSGGEQGFDIPLAGPLSLLGLQLRLDSGAEAGQTAIAWLAVIAVFVCIGFVAVRRRVHTPIIIAVACATANALAIVVRTGSANYATHKTMAVAIALVAPFAAVHLVSRVPAEWARVRAVGVVGFAVASGLVAHDAATQVRLVASHELGQALEDPRIDEVDTLNVDLGDLFENSIAALAADSEQVVVTGSTYARPSLPVGSTFLLEQPVADTWNAVSIPLGGGYVLADVDLTVRPGEPLVFDAAHPANDRYLYQSWYPIENAGVWSGERANPDAAVVVDLPPELLGGDVQVTLLGARFVVGQTSRELHLAANGVELAQETFTEFVPREVTVTVPRELAAANGGRLVLSFATPDLVSPASSGADDKRNLGFFLQWVTFSAAGAATPPG